MGLITDFIIGTIVVMTCGTALFAIAFSTTTFLNVVNSTGLAPTNSLPYQAGLAVASNLYSFNIYIPVVFFALNIIAIMLATFLRPNVMNIAIGIVLLIFLPIVSAILSNATRLIFLEPLLEPIALKFPAILQIAAQFPLYTFFFMLAYLIILAIRAKQFQGNTPITGMSEQTGGAY